MDPGLDGGLGSTLRSGWSIVDGAEVHVRERWMLVTAYMVIARGVIGDVGSR
jgi:hypothetical protein